MSFSHFTRLLLLLLLVLLSRFVVPVRVGHSFNQSLICIPTFKWLIAFTISVFESLSRFYAESVRLFWNFSEILFLAEMSMTQSIPRPSSNRSLVITHLNTHAYTQPHSSTQINTLAEQVIERRTDSSGLPIPVSCNTRAQYYGLATLTNLIRNFENNWIRNAVELMHS